MTIIQMYYSCQIAIQYGLVFSLQIALYRRVKEMIQRFQNRALRVCCLCDRYTSNLELHVQNNVLPIDLRCKMDILNLMYNIAYRNHSNLDPERDERLGPYTRLSAAPTLQCPRPNSSKFLVYFLCRSTNVAQSPCPCEKYTSLASFKKEVNTRIWAEFTGLNRI